jgi:hypothetical protein
MSKFDQELELADALDENERESLISIPQARLRKERRAELAEAVKEANKEFQSGRCSAASVEGIIDSLKA